MQPVSLIADLPRPLLYIGDEPAPPDAVMWSRQAAPWPPDGPFASAVLRLPLDKNAYEMVLHAIAARLGPGAPLLVYGANDEGIKSAGKALPPFFENIEVVAVKAHARIWQATRSSMTEGLRGALSDWRHGSPLEIAGKSYDWIAYPGVFAKGGLDAGTALLLAHLPEVSGKPVLDFGTGTGVIARAIADLGARVTMVEHDAVALEAAKANVPDATPVLGGAPPEGRFALIFSNPPIHVGKHKNLTVLASLIANAKRHLSKGGALVIVTQKTVPVPRIAEGHLTPRLIADANGYRLWELSEGSARSAKAMR